MLFVLSPAKALDYETPLPPGLPHTQPLFVPQAAALIEVLRRQSPQQIASLMSISDALAGLNVARYQAWQPTFTAANARQAVLAFNGDVYEGLQAASLSLPQLDWLQARLCILSGLYGVLRPLDWMQPYRLEMGARLVTDRGDNLYQFWDGRITDYLNQRLAEQGRAQGGDAQPAVLVNLASQEYFKAVQRKRLQARVIDCVFEDYKNGQYKIISFNAKRARGLMVRFCAQQGIDRPEGLQAFDLDGYAFAPAASEPERLVFRRRR